MTSDDLRERVARAIYEGKRARLLAAFGDTEGWPEWETLRPTLQEIQREECDPFIALIRNEVLEEVAKAIFNGPRYGQDVFDSMTETANGSWLHEDDIATAIRALKDAP